MWKYISLRTRIYLILISLVLITFVGGLVMVWYTYRIEGLFARIIDRNVAAFQVAEALETALVSQKGFVTYFFLDNDPDWLRQLGEYRQIFKERLREAASLVETEDQKEIVSLIESEYGRYIELKDRVIAYYKAGERDIGSKVHKDVRQHFLKTLDLCAKYKDFYTKEINQVRDQSLYEARRLRVIAGTAVLFALILAFILFIVLVRHILDPVRKLAVEADRQGMSTGSGDEVKALSRSVRGLIEDMNHTHIELEKSRETLLQSEKMATVGRLAAGFAHSIRNPLTSVKMRLFSLSRTLRLSVPQNEDFKVISEEINHIDTIVQNFLEFSRPPKLKKQEISPSEIVDLALQLLRHRLESYDVDIEIERKKPLPKIQADPEQLKEVFVNIIVNACEAMEFGGMVKISEEEGFEKLLGKVVTIRLTDNGPGIPESIRDKIMQPFFTTKEEGTGLGLSIASRIVAEHGGRFDMVSEEGQGTIIIITLPIMESSFE
ncbi:MAG: histidine kinase [Deltaproteobacteria bacterium]|nr:histidine kinase [Deltaproteobacteria bacterium]